MFLLFPTLVYELEYPRTPRIRWSYFFEKVFSFIGLISVLHVIVVNYIEPILVNTAKLSMFEAIANLVIPCLLGHLIIFYMIFDIFGNAIGELTRFADREFYSDWWNRFSKFIYFFPKDFLIFFLKVLLLMNMQENGTNLFMNGCYVIFT